MLLKVKDWETFQHYKDRKPPWIKLHRDLLDDYEYHLLPVDSRALAPMLWLIASEALDGCIHLDIEALAFRLRTTSAALGAALNPLIDKGFFILERGASELLAWREQPACPEAEREAETERETEAAAEAEQRGCLPALPAAAADFNEAHLSAFAFGEVEDFVRATKPHARNPGGMARRLWRSGEEDGAIRQWMETRAGPVWPAWVFDPKEPGTIEEKKRYHLQLCEESRRVEAEFKIAASDAA